MILTKEVKSCYELARRFIRKTLHLLRHTLFFLPVPQSFQQILVDLIIILRLNLQLNWEMDDSLTAIKKMF